QDDTYSDLANEPMNDSAPPPDNDKIIQSLLRVATEHSYFALLITLILSTDEAIANKALPDLELEVEATTVSHWEIEDWRGLDKRVHGPEFEVAGYKWCVSFEKTKVLLFPHGNNQTEYTSVYLEFSDQAAQPQGWHVCAQFALLVSNPNDPTQYVIHNAQHRFTAEEADWGFTRFHEVRRLGSVDDNRTLPLVQDNATTITAVVRIMKDPTGVLWHSFVNYDSKKMTGFVGLKNQGATCYMNSLFQSLYCTNYFRKVVYQIPTENDDPTKSVALALQRVFYNLQYQDAPVGTTELTKSFGWDSLEAFNQHDVQEFNRVLQDNLEMKMKNTPADGAINKLFLGKMKSYIKCINVDYESSRVEDYYDIQLNVKGCKNLEESFKEYIVEETLEGDNKYMAEGYGLQDAKKGVIFESFPPVLHLQLKRFEFDMMRDMTVKINDRHEFPLEIDLEPYLSESADKSQPHKYILQGVLVHSGDLSGGHYFAFVRPTKDSNWLKFDDDRVTPATLKEVLEENYGGEPQGANALNTRPNLRTIKRFTNAYMLVYMRESMMDEILSDVTTNDIPPHLKRRLDEERVAMEQKRKERLEMHLYMKTCIITDETFSKYQGFDLASFDEKTGDTPAYLSYRTRKDDTLESFKAALCENLDIPFQHLRLWILVNRQNRTVRPDTPILESDYQLTMEQIREKTQPSQPNLRLYLEVADHFENGQAIFQAPPSSRSPTILVFIKLFDAATQSVHGLGHLYVDKNGRVGDIIPTLNAMAGFEKDTQLMLFEEIKPTMIDPMDVRLTFVRAEIQDGDIICIQKHISEENAQQLRSQHQYPIVPEYLDYLLKRVTIQFKPRFGTGTGGQFDLTLSRSMLYDVVATKVGEKLNASPQNIRFTAPGVSGTPKTVIRHLPNSTLMEMIQPSMYNGVNVPTLFYEVLDIPLSELETKKQVKITVLTPTLLEEKMYDMVLPKDNKISDLLQELERKGVKFESDSGTRLPRIFEAVQNKFIRELDMNETLSALTDSAYCTLYAEEIPEEETTATDDDFFVYVFHYQKETSRTHGVPFKFLVKKDEPFSQTKLRLQRRTGMDDKDWARVKFTIASSYSATPIDDDDFKLSDHHFAKEEHLGLDHIDKTGKASRVAGTERSIFIRG
ncbi:hypothetical protein INT43_001268, partial [Umbelopsis isabellina]